MVNLSIYYKRSEFFRYLTFWVAHSIGYSGYLYLDNFLNFSNPYIYIVLGGLLIQLSAKIVQSLFRWRFFKIDWRFIKYIIWHSILLAGMTYLLKFISPLNIYLEIMLIGFAITILTSLSYKISKSSFLNKDSIITFIWIILIIGVLFYNSYLRNTNSIELDIYNQLNELREQQGIHSFKWSDSIHLVAKEHSKDMMSNSYFSHMNLKGEDPSERGIKSGVGQLAENINEMPITLPPFVWNSDCIITFTNHQIASCAMNGWINSPGHYVNMIDPTYSKVGIGVSCGFLSCKLTQNFQ